MPSQLEADQILTISLQVNIISGNTERFELASVRLLHTSPNSSLVPGTAAIRGRHLLFKLFISYAAAFNFSAFTVWLTEHLQLISYVWLNPIIHPIQPTKLVFIASFKL